MKLEYVTCGFDSSNGEEYLYTFFDGITMKRSYVLESIRTNSEVLVFKIPFIHKYIFLNELVCLVLVCLFIAFFLFKIYNANNRSNFNYILNSILLFVFIRMTMYMCTTFLAQVGVFLYGKDVNAIVQSKKEVESNSAYSPITMYELILDNKKMCRISYFGKFAYEKGDEFTVKIHPDNIPYIAPYSSYVYYLYIFLCPSVYLLVILYGLIKLF